MGFKLLFVVLISAILTAIVMPFYIKMLKSRNLNQAVSEYALEEYKQKQKTPIMGGLVFVVVPLIVLAIVYPDAYTNKDTLMIIVSFVSYCLVGFWDDILILLRHNNEGLSPRFKLILEIIITTIIFFVFRDVLSLSIDIPFINSSITLPWFIFLPFMILLYTAEANAVNFTDGMDGLCAGVSFIALIPFAIISCVKGMHHITIMIMPILGGLIGYLFFNFHPAKIFMGDSGSLALGGLFASLSIILNKEIALFVIGGVFVWEMFCVCLQLTSVKLFHIKVFKYTPIHYSFVLRGMKEVDVVLMFYLIGAILAVIGTIIGLN